MPDANHVAAALALPSRHRQHLYAAFGVKVGKSVKKERKAELLADALAKHQAPNYSAFYLGQGATLVNYFKFEHPFDLDAIEQMLREHNAALFTVEGARPDLLKNPNPQLHRVLRVMPDSLVVELAALDMKRHLRRNWVDEDTMVDHIYRVALKNEPPTIEVRSIYGKAERLIAPLSIAGVSIAGHQRVMVNREREERLKTSLKAKGWRAYGEHEHVVMSRSMVQANEDVDLQGTTEHEEWLKREGVREIAHAYLFRAEWPQDKYDEIVGYRVDRGTEQVSITTSNSSEIGLDHLRKHVVALV